MKTKLTLSIDKDLVEYAHKRARARKQSVSYMFSEYLKQQLKVQRQKQKTPTIADMTGSLKAYAINDTKESIRSAYAKKYSR